MPVPHMLARLAAMTLAWPGLAAAQAPADPATTRPTLPPLHHEAVAFDAARGRLVLYAGSDSLDGTWEWDGRRWHLAADSAASPPARVGATMGYDPEQRRILLFGGWQGTPWGGGPFTPFCDTWSFDGRRWTRLTDGACVTDRVRDNSLVFDSRRRTMLLVDGTPEVPPATVRPLRLWRWAADRWVLVDSTGPRRGGWNRAVFDDRRGVLVMPVLDGPDAGAWEWDGERWRRDSSAGPPPRHVHALAYDSRRRQVVLVGGQTLSRPARYLDDAWSWDGTRWSPLTGIGDSAPGARAGGRLFDDARNRRLLYFGGYKGPPPQFLAELWLLSDSGWRQWGSTAGGEPDR